MHRTGEGVYAGGGFFFLGAACGLAFRRWAGSDLYHFCITWRFDFLYCITYEGIVDSPCLGHLCHIWTCGEAKGRHS